MESIVFSDNQAPEAPQADTYFMDPPGPFGYRLHEVIQRCDFCYLSFDPGARWRPFIQDKRQKENEL
jgi:hypothetical protein